MKELKQLLEEHHPLVSFDDNEIEMLAGIAKLVDFPGGEVLFQETDAAESILLVLSGSVDLYTCLKGDVEQNLMTVRPGGFVGALALIDDGLREVNARAAEDTAVYVFDKLALSSLTAEQHGLGVKLLRLVADILSKRLRITIASLRQNLEWTLQVSGLASLDISQLIVDRVGIEIELINGKQLVGAIIKAEQRTSGFELFLATSDGNIHIIPYHAIVSACLPGNEIKSNLDQSSNY